MASDTSRAPVRISKVTDRYLLFDIDDIMYLRRHHNICSPFVGTMPQAPSQNVFMGLPIELMAEEAKVLVDKKAAYVVDDSVFHPSRIASAGPITRDSYLQAIKRDGTRAATAARELSEYKKAQALSKVKGKGKKDKKPKQESSTDNAGLEVRDPPPSVAEELSLFDTSETAKISKAKPPPVVAEPYAITPVTSGALLTPPPEEDTSSLIDKPRGYPLYAHLHDKGYYMMPGLRFGCDYNVYPGDPLRYHSHFQATHYGWNEQIQLLDIVTGGRLGTNVKKAYLIGGELPADKGKAEDDAGRSHAKVENSVIPPVRAFSIEWAAM
ncbi:putative PAXNEB protein-domain-containing protein [Seiridium cardinale]